VDYLAITSHDLNQIRLALAPAIQQARVCCTPLVIEFETDRLGPHSKGDDTRSADELAALHARDWYTRYSDLFPQQFERADAAARTTIEQLVREVAARPLAQWRLP
jgi:pyruvate dehydrogenase E1 component alpha subunit